MASPPYSAASRLGHVVAAGFLGGAIPVLVVYQLIALAFYVAGWNANPPDRMNSAGAVGLPLVLNLTMWGGFWGIGCAFALRQTAGRYPAWLIGLGFGVLATLAGWFIFAPLRGQAVAQNWNLAPMFRVLFVNGAWGITTGLLAHHLLRCFSVRFA
jgi:hypothetical protein